MSVFAAGIPADFESVLAHELRNRGVVLQCIPASKIRACLAANPVALFLGPALPDPLPAAALSHCAIVTVGWTAPGQPASLVHPIDSAQLAILLDSRFSHARLRHELAGCSPGMDLVRDYIQRIGSTDCNVMITGETGTGKELAAELIHANSQRAAKAFVAINCAAIPEALFESEFFGFERGAFTGAHRTTPGQLEAAQGGTVFLDEVGELPLPGQAKLLRLVERKTVCRVGGRQSIPIDIRIIAATNRNLEELVARGEFRSDLLFRLDVGRLHMPPLRERRQDLPELIDRFTTQFREAYHAQVSGVEKETLESLENHDWPGNVRELRSVIERMFVSRTSATLTIRDLPPWQLTFRQMVYSGKPPASSDLLSVLQEAHWNKTKAAEKLKWSRSKLYRKLAKAQMLEAKKQTA